MTGLDGPDQSGHSSLIMRRVSVTELKNALSRYLRLVKQGETVEIVERSVPVARIHGVRGQTAGDADLLGRLSRDGLVTRARRAPDRSLLRRRPIASKLDPVAALRRERDGE
jgi:prevent-host-death family protein